MKVEQIKVFGTAELPNHVCTLQSEHLLLIEKKVNDWLCEKGDGIIITYRHICFTDQKYPTVWIFYKES